jgi:osmotically inducible protein OsmC
MPDRTSEAVWEKDLKTGSGTMTVGRNAYRGPYSFKSRFENGEGTNPEELLAAAHAGCYSMALSHELSQAGHTPDRVHTVATVALEQGEGGFRIPRIDLTVDAQVPGIDQAAFDKIAETAKKNCPVSKLFSSAEIRLKTTLKG